MKLEYLPVGLPLKGKRVLVIGGGRVAEGKIKKILLSGAKVTVMSPGVSGEIRRLEEEGQIRVVLEKFSPDSTAFEADLVVAATPSKIVNASVSKIYRAAGIPVNVVDDPSLSDFIFLAVSAFDGFFVALSSDGKNPGVSARIREFLDLHRAEIQERVIRGKRHPKKDKPSGKVYLTGAGPGSPDLLTVRALTALKSADVVIKDYLVPDEVIEFSGTRARVISLSKKSAPGHSLGTDRQDYVNRLMARLAKGGNVVVRLKSGDPFIFGRGGEEMEYLIGRGVEVDVIPGITAAVGAAAEARIPLTHRDHSSSLLFITGRENPAKGGSSIDLKYLPGGATVVSYMSISSAKNLMDRFLEDGVPENTPAAIVEKATWPDQRVLYTTVGKIEETVMRDGVTAPALIFVGETVDLALGLVKEREEHPETGGQTG